MTQESLPQYNVFLIDDDHNDALMVAQCTANIMKQDKLSAIKTVKQAHKTGQCLLTTTHKEHAELIVDQFAQHGVIAQMEES